jgi:hypothetical protein
MRERRVLAVLQRRWINVAELTVEVASRRR